MSYTNSSDLYLNLSIIYPNSWIDIPVLTQFYSSSFTTTTLTTAANYYRMALSGSNTLISTGNSDFTNNSSSYINVKYVGSNLNNRNCKFTYNFSYKIDKLNETLTFCVNKNP